MMLYKNMDDYHAGFSGILNLNLKIWGFIPYIPIPKTRVWERFIALKKRDIISYLSVIILLYELSP